jgi:hypothetical protein
MREGAVTSERWREGEEKAGGDGTDRRKRGMRETYREMCA